MTAISDLEFARGAMGRNQIHPVLLEVGIEPIAVIRAIPNEMLRLGLQHVEVETQLDQGDFMMIRHMCADREEEPMPIHNRKDLHAFGAFGEGHIVPTSLRGGEGRVNETLPFINRPSSRSGSPAG